MMTIAILFKNGKEIRVKCETFNHRRDAFGNLTGWDIRDCTENLVLWADVSDVTCIYRVLSDERKEND